MTINKNLAISDSGFIFNPSSGDSFSTNSIGLEIIRLFKQDKTKDEVIKSITENYVVDASTFEKDINDFISMLSSYQLIINEQ